MARTQDDSGHLDALRRPRAKIALISAAALIIGGGTAIGVALSSQHHAPQPSRSAAGATSPGSPPAGAPAPASSVPLPWAGETAQQLEAAQGPTLPGSVPVSLQIPALGVSSKVMRLGLASDGTMQVPPLFGQPSEAGWYRVLPHARAARAVGHRRAHRHLPRTFGVLPARRGPARRRGRRRPGRRDHRGVPGHRRARVLQVQLPVADRLRPDQQCGPPPDHVRRGLRLRDAPLPGQHGGVRVAGVRPASPSPSVSAAGRTARGRRSR